MFSFVFPSLRPATVLFPKSNRSMKQSLYQCHAKKLVRLVNRLHWGANTCNRICINAYTPWPSNLLYIVHTSELLRYILLFTNMSVFSFSLFVSLVYYGWKYCSLVCCERKTLLDDCWFRWIAQTNRCLSFHHRTEKWAAVGSQHLALPAECSQTHRSSPCLVPPILPQIPLCKKKIPRHIKMSANAWSTKCW
jgi:hypothetical protein